MGRGGMSGGEWKVWDKWGMRGKEVGGKTRVRRLRLVLDRSVLTTVLSLAVPVWFEG